jgi:hypothetical protein
MGWRPVGFLVALRRVFDRSVRPVVGFGAATAGATAFFAEGEAAAGEATG